MRHKILCLMGSVNRDLTVGLQGHPGNDVMRCALWLYIITVYRHLEKSINETTTC